MRWRPKAPLTLALALAGVVTPLPAQPTVVPTRIDVAEGVYLFQTPPYGDAGLDGNSAVIVSDEGVLVFDSNGTPSAAAAVLAEIRRLTSQPVKYLVNSHWHWDHWYGAQVYKDAFPGLEIITHERTRQLMAGPAIAFNQPGLDTQLPAHISSVEQALARARSAPPRGDTTALLAHIARDRSFLDEKRNTRHTLATRTFTDSLVIQLGRRKVVVRHTDRAITPGDAWLWLPDERIAVLGDLLINPITFALFCYPGGWIRTLQSIDALDAAVLVPGHGDPMRDEALLKATTALLMRERSLAAGARARGLPVDQAKAGILADAEILRLRETITGGVAARNDAFALYLVDWFVRRVYQELDGSLDDSIPRLPG